MSAASNASDPSGQTRRFVDGAQRPRPLPDGGVALRQMTLRVDGSPGLESPLEAVRFVVVRKVVLTDTIIEVDLVPLRERIVHRPGQYVLITDPDFRVPPRSYSVANTARDDGSVRLLVTRVAGGATSGWIHERLQTGDTVLLSGPYGSFVDEPAWTGPVLHLAGGSGLAPILALVETELAAELRRHVDILFSARHPTDMYLRDVLRGWEKSYPTFEFRITLTRSAGQALRGRIPDVLPGLFPDLSGYLVFVAGSSGLVDACAAAAMACGAHRYRVRTEAFFTEPQPWRSPAASPLRHC